MEVDPKGFETGREMVRFSLRTGHRCCPKLVLGASDFDVDIDSIGS